MNIIDTGIDGLVLAEPRVFSDARGSFYENFSSRSFCEKVRHVDFVQDNVSKSVYGALRGLHYQLSPYAQSKLVGVLHGRILDVAVDIRRGSPTFGRHFSVELTADNSLLLFVPRGFAHGYVCLSDEAVVYYKCDNYYSPLHERGILFSDPDLDIDWLLPQSDLIVSEKDCLHPNLAEAVLFDYAEKL